MRLGGRGQKSLDGRFRRVITRKRLPDLRCRSNTSKACRKTAPRLKVRGDNTGNVGGSYGRARRRDANRASSLLSKYIATPRFRNIASSFGYKRDVIKQIRRTLVFASEIPLFFRSTHRPHLMSRGRGRLGTQLREVESGLPIYTPKLHFRHFPLPLAPRHRTHRSRLPHRPRHRRRRPRTRPPPRRLAQPARASPKPTSKTAPSPTSTTPARLGSPTPTAPSTKPSSPPTAGPPTSPPRKSSPVSSPSTTNAPPPKIRKPRTPNPVNRTPRRVYRLRRPKSTLNPFRFKTLPFFAHQVRT